MHRNLLAFCLFAALPTIIAQSTTSLYIPGFDSQPIDASMAGVDSSGQTTWLLSPGPVTADEDSGFVGTVTLVEGSDGAHLTYAGPDVSLGIDCALASGLAVCSGSADGTVATETETIVSIAVALASGTAAPASATATTGQSSSAGTSSQGTSGSGTASPAQTGTAKNSAEQLAVAYVSFACLTGLVVFLL